MTKRILPRHSSNLVAKVNVDRNGKYESQDKVSLKRSFAHSFAAHYLYLSTMYGVSTSFVSQMVPGFSDEFPLLMDAIMGSNATNATQPIVNPEANNGTLSNSTLLPNHSYYPEGFPAWSAQTAMIVWSLVMAATDTALRARANSNDPGSGNKEGTLVRVGHLATGSLNQLFPVEVKELFSEGEAAFLTMAFMTVHALQGAFSSLLHGSDGDHFTSEMLENFMWYIMIPYMAGMLVYNVASKVTPVAKAIGLGTIGCCLWGYGKCGEGIAKLGKGNGAGGPAYIPLEDLRDTETFQTVSQADVGSLLGKLRDQLVQANREKYDISGVVQKIIDDAGDADNTQELIEDYLHDNHAVGLGADRREKGRNASAMASYILACDSHNKVVDNDADVVLSMK